MSLQTGKVHPTPGHSTCQNYVETDGKPRTWMSESVDLTDRGSSYWTTFWTSTRKPYMAYSYLDDGQWKYVWVYAGAILRIV